MANFMALGSSKPLTEKNISSISWGKGGRCVRLTTLPPSCAVIMKSGNLNYLEPSGLLRACNGTALPLTLLENFTKLFRILLLRDVAVKKMSSEMTMKILTSGKRYSVVM